MPGELSWMTQVFVDVPLVEFMYFVLRAKTRAR